MNLLARSGEQANVVNAFASGYEIESRPIKSNGPCEALWEVESFPSWNWEEFEYRVKAKPQWRAFKGPEEFPLGFIKIRAKDSPYWSIVLSLSETKITGISFDEIRQVSFSTCFENGDEISLDGGKTWQPCGVKM